ncbi:MAG: TetR family transcriptional regulator [Actinobacteria bacterium]|nr:TetR family transcriptional regulator [Actinomycetota bacterium]
MKSRLPASPPRRPRARRGEGEKLRDDIMEAAEELLISTGSVEAVSIRAVADAVGVTPPSIYMHFADKNDLIFAVCEKHFQKFDEFLEEASSASEDPLESLFLRGRAYVRFGLQNPEHYRILFMTKPALTPERFQDEGMIARMAAFQHLIEAVERCIKGGAFDGDPLELSLLLWSYAHGLTSLLISKPDFPWPDIDRLIDRALRLPISALQKEST